MKSVDSQTFVSRLKIILLSHKIKDYISEDMLGSMLDNLIPVAYADGYFDLTYLEIYLSREFNVPPDKVDLILKDIQSIQDKLEIKTIRTSATSVPTLSYTPKNVSAPPPPVGPLPPLRAKPQEAAPPKPPSSPPKQSSSAGSTEQKKTWKCPRCGTIQSKSPICPQCDLNIEGFASLQNSYRKREMEMGLADLERKDGFFNFKNIGVMVAMALLIVFVAYKIITNYYGSDVVMGAKKPPLSSLSAEPLSESDIQLSWSCKSCNQTEFVIERKSGADNSYTRVGSVNADHNKFKDPQLNEGSNYCYRIRFEAYAKHYNVVCVSTYPAQPTDLAAKTDLGSGVSLSWRDNSGNEGGYVVERKSGAEKKYETISELSADETSYSDADVVEGKKYCYRVGVYKSSPKNLIYSNDVCGESAKSKPGVPSNIKAVISEDQTIYISWTDNSDNEEGFIVERRTPNEGTFRRVKSVGPNETQVTDIGYPSGMDYYYRVKAFNSGGESGYSNETKVTSPKINRNPYANDNSSDENERADAIRCANRCYYSCRGNRSCLNSCISRCAQ